MMDMNRRSFLRGLLVVTAATTLPTAALKAIEAINPIPVLYGDGIRDDTAALQAFLDGRAFRTIDGFEGIAEEAKLSGALLRVSKTLEFGRQKGCVLEDCVLDAMRNFEGNAIFKAVDAESTGHFQGCLFRRGMAEEFHGHTKISGGDDGPSGFDRRSRPAFASLPYDKVEDRDRDHDT